MKQTWLVIGCAVLLSLGCAAEYAVNEKEAVKLPQDLLSEQEIKTFLKIVGKLSDRQAPAFSPLTEPLELSDPPEQLVRECIAQFQRQFDPKRQGKIWLNTPEVRDAAANSQWSTVKLAGVMRTLSSAISRSQMTTDQDPEQLHKKARREVARLQKELAAIDGLPKQKVTRETVQKRTQTAMALGKAVALQEYLKVMSSIPEENLVLVRRFQKQLKPLVDSHGVQGLEELAKVKDPEEERNSKPTITHADFSLPEKSTGGPIQLASNSTPEPISDARLKKQILQEIPELPEALKNKETLKAAELLLGWAARTGDFSLDGVHLASGETVSEFYYKNFEPNVVGMSCGGYANYYSSLLKLFQIESLNVSFGERPKLTHVTVIVPVQVEGKWKFYLLDPTFGATFHKRGSKQPATYFDLITALDGGTLNQFTWKTVLLETRDYLSPEPSQMKQLVLKKKSEENYVYSWPSYSVESYLELYAEDLRAEQYPTGMRGLAALMKHRVYQVVPYGNSPTLTAARRSFESQVQARGITFGD